MKNWEIRHLNLLQLSVKAHGAASRCSQRSDKPIGNWHDQLMTDPSTCCDYHAANLQGITMGLFKLLCQYSYGWRLKSEPKARYPKK